MNVKENFILIGISILLICGLTACDKPGPAETAGKKIDQSATEASKKIGEATHEIGKKLGKQDEK
jgi:hyperosmotically inducible protein